jgi:hypothetical protein
MTGNHNPLVGGSNPSSATKSFNDLADIGHPSGTGESRLVPGPRRRLSTASVHQEEKGAEQQVGVGQEGNCLDRARERLIPPTRSIVGTRSSLG